MNKTLLFQLGELVSVCDGRLVSFVSTSTATQFRAMAYDSRKPEPGDIFLCIRGNKVDGHDFVPEAISHGATLIIGEDSAKLTAYQKQFSKILFIVVPSSLKALQQLARFYRPKFQVPAVGIAGSNGKTTTKDLTVAVLRTAAPTLATEGSLNNHWGVPQTVMRFQAEDQAAVFELGMNHFGEIQDLCSLCRPEVGLITNIGKEHLELMGNEEGALKANRELFDWIEEKAISPLLVFNLDDARLKALHAEFSSGKRARLITYSQTDTKADVRLVSHEPLGFEHRFGWHYVFETPWGRVEGNLPLPGPHNLVNALAATAAALATKVATPEHVSRGLAQPHLSKMRSNLFRSSSGVLVYDDSYNANPSSFAALFESASEIRGYPRSGVKRVIAAVGDMLELGPESMALHRETGACAASKGIDLLLAVGDFKADWVQGFKAGANSGSREAIGFDDKGALKEKLRKALSEDPASTLLLVKGSRGARMEDVLELFKTA